jgi:hypothetical protein
VVVSIDEKSQIQALAGLAPICDADGQPTPHFVAFSQAVLFRGADISLVWRDLAAMVAIGVVYFTVASVRFRKAIFG